MEVLALPGTIGWRQLFTVISLSQPEITAQHSHGEAEIGSYIPPPVPFVAPCQATGYKAECLTRATRG